MAQSPFFRALVMKLITSLMSLGSGTTIALAVKSALVEKKAVAPAIRAAILAYLVRRRVLV
jgi:predicted sugar kinase